MSILDENIVTNTDRSVEGIMYFRERMMKMFQKIQRHHNTQVAPKTIMHNGISYYFNIHWKELNTFDRQYKMVIHVFSDRLINSNQEYLFKGNVERFIQDQHFPSGFDYNSLIIDRFFKGGKDYWR